MHTHVYKFISMRSIADQNTHPLESTNRSRLNHLELLGFALKNLYWNIHMNFRCKGVQGDLPCEEDVCNRGHTHGCTLERDRRRYRL